MNFEFDSKKSDSNLVKHGIDFISAQLPWVDENVLELQARTEDEPRWIVIGSIGGRIWSAIVTRRNDAVRIISVRRARPADENTVDVIDHLDVKSARRPQREVQRINVDFPVWMVSSLDAEAAHLGITRQAVTKTWIAEHLDRHASQLERKHASARLQFLTVHTKDVNSQTARECFPRQALTLGSR